MYRNVILIFSSPFYNIINSFDMQCLDELMFQKVGGLFQATDEFQPTHSAYK